MKLIVGLGNIGDKYKNTRHNVGFMILDLFKEYIGFNDFLEKNNLSSFVSTGFLDSEKIILAKPTTFMNNSGQAVFKLKNFFKIQEKDILIIQDDSDLNEIGKIKIKKGGGSAGHNGAESVKNVLKEGEYLRLLFGVRDQDKDKGKKAMAFVLKPFPKEKKSVIIKRQERALRCIKFFCEGEKVEKLMNIFN